MIKQLLRLLKPWKMIAFYEIKEAKQRRIILSRAGYSTKLKYCDTKWIVRYK